VAGFRKAKAEQAALKMGFYGPAGSGKTFTALLVAEGLAAHDGRRVAFVDTERGTDFYCKTVPDRAVHPEAFDFDALYSRSLTETLAEVRQLDPAEYSTVVIDSITHLWEAARNSYTGKVGPDGQIPMHAWGKIKKPYKDLIAYLLSSPMHVILCGRQGNEFSEDEHGKVTHVGVKMKAEGETPYEPHILLRLETVKDKQGAAHVYAFVEKDRSGVLQGKDLYDPTFATIAAPVLKLLGGTQARIETDDETSLKDSESLAEQERAKEEGSARLLKKFRAMIDLAEGRAGLEAVGKQITPQLKQQMTKAHVDELREIYRDAERQFKDRGAVTPPAATGAGEQVAAPGNDTAPAGNASTTTAPAPGPSKDISLNTTVDASGKRGHSATVVDTSESQAPPESPEEFKDACRTLSLSKDDGDFEGSEERWNAAWLKALKQARKRNEAELTDLDRKVIVSSIENARGAFSYLKQSADQPA
jgi:hypothetical protein